MFYAEAARRSISGFQHARAGPSGLGIDAQRAAVARFAEARASRSSPSIVEIETGKGADALDRRPQLAARAGRGPPAGQG